jgi:hypothetical protein
MTIAPSTTGPSRGPIPHCARRMSAAAMTFLAAASLACQTATKPRAALEPQQPDAPAPAGYELIYRKLGDVPAHASTVPGEPFTSAEVEQLTAVLRQRVNAIHPSWGVSAIAEADGFLHVLFPDAPSDAAVLELRPALEVPGHLAFEGVADASTPGWDGGAERKRLGAWWKAQTTPDLEHYNALPRDEGGPPDFVRWRVQPNVDANATSEADRWRWFVPCVKTEVLHPDRDWDFGAEDLGRVFRSHDDTGFPAIGFELRGDRREAFADFTAAYTERQIAVVLDGWAVLSDPGVNDPLRGSSIIAGRFEQNQVDAWIAALKSGPLPMRLEFVTSAVLTR